MINERKLLVQRLGLVDYETGLALQKETEQAVKLRTQPDTLLLVEHPHTLTIGRRGNSSAVLLDAEQLKRRNVTVFETNRMEASAMAVITPPVCLLRAELIEFAPPPTAVHGTMAGIGAVPQLY